MKLYFLVLFLSANLMAQTYEVALPDFDAYPHYKNEKGKAMGVLPSIMNAFAKDQNITINYQFLPIRRYVEYLNKNKIDFVLPDNPQWVPQKKVKLSYHYTDVIMQSRVGVLVKEENQNLKKTELETLGTIQGFTVHGFDNEIKEKKLTVSYNAHAEALLKQVEIGRIQGAYFHLDQALYLAKHHAIKIVLAEKLPTIDYSYHLSTLKHPDVIKNFNTWLAKNQKVIEDIKLEHAITIDRSLAPSPQTQLVYAHELE